MYWIFKTGCLKVNVLSCYHSYLFNEIMIRQMKFSLQAGMIVVVGDAILRLNYNPYTISIFFFFLLS